MIAPRKLKYEAGKKEKENMEFRTFLKCNAEGKELDKQFKKLHEELFANYDCSRCRNCCKMYHGNIPAEDLEQDAAFLNMTKEQFVNTFLVKNEIENTYETKNKPCDFLGKDGECILKECRPESCKKYPYTDQPERLHSLFGMLNAIEVCPVAFEIYERLKKEYHFNGQSR